MTKADLIAVIAEKLKFPWARAELLIDQIFDSMIDALKRGEGIEIRGFGSFTIREYKSYEGRNPRTGATVHVRPKRLAFFKVGKELRERVNAGRLRAPSGTTTTASSAGPGGSAGSNGVAIGPPASAVGVKP
jgi:integration host factor subunit beta